jgi:hypothetical protein
MTYPCNGKSGSRVGNGVGVGEAFMSVGVSVGEKGSVASKGDVGKIVGQRGLLAVAVAGMGEFVGVLEAAGVPAGAGERLPQATRSRIITSQEKRFRNAAIIMCLS